MLVVNSYRLGEDKDLITTIVELGQARTEVYVGDVLVDENKDEFIFTGICHVRYYKTMGINPNQLMFGLMPSRKGSFPVGTLTKRDTLDREDQAG